MNAPQLDPTDDTLAWLERRVRWLTALATFLAIAVVALVAWQLAPPAEVGATRRFALWDASGHRRAELALRADGSPVLRLQNENGRSGIVMSLDTEGSARIHLNDANGAARLDLVLDPRGWPRLALTAPGGHAAVKLGVGEQGPAASLRDSGATVLWSAP